jgi:hypothetical protein
MALTATMPIKVSARARFIRSLPRLRLLHDNLVRYAEFKHLARKKAPMFVIWCAANKLQIPIQTIAYYFSFGPITETNIMTYAPGA